MASFQTLILIYLLKHILVHMFYLFCFDTVVNDQSIKIMKTTFYLSFNCLQAKLSITSLLVIKVKLF